MERQLKLGSLFDGSGGFPLAGMLNGIRPVWASEIEPFPMLVTTKRIPQMKHLGDIRKINGGEIEPVDIITFGSPCQDMSVAGTHEGLAGQRSGLFFEAVRVIREMREATDGHYPRYIVWENVPGAFSSRRGEDFRAVLEEICSLAGEEDHLPRPQAWPGAGCILGNGSSAAWRVLDACGWGVPQRRRRIYLVGDLGGCSAGKILFESEVVSGYSAAGFSAWQRTARSAQNGARETGSDRLTIFSGGFRMENSMRGGRTIGWQDETAPTLSAAGAAGQSGVVLYSVPDASVYESSKASHFTLANRDVADTLYASDWKEPPLINRGEYAVRRLTPTECARLQGFPDWWTDDLATENPTDQDIRRWKTVWDAWSDTYGKRKRSEEHIAKWLWQPYTDAAAYKMWGNGVALPCAAFVLAGIVWNEDGRMRRENYYSGEGQRGQDT